MNKTTLKEYRAWKAMKARCNAPSARKGVYLKINVCDRWKNSYQNFVSDMGNAPSDKHSLDRIDNTKGYFPENCRWSTFEEQCKNRGTFNKVFTYENKSMVLKDWAKHFKIPYTTLYNRIFRNNIPFEKAIIFKRKTFIYKNFEGSLKELCLNFSKVPYQNVVDRLHKKWDLEKALNTPLKSNMI